MRQQDKTQHSYDRPQQEELRLSYQNYAGYEYKVMRDILDAVDHFNVNYDVVVGIARGGLPLACHLSYKLSCDFAMAQFNLDGKNIVGDTKAVVEISDTKEVFGKHVLLVDDLVDSGETMTVLKTFLEVHMHATSVDTAVVFYKLGSTFKPTYFAAETDKWVLFPWEQ